MLCRGGNLCVLILSRRRRWGTVALLLPLHTLRVATIAHSQSLRRGDIVEMEAVAGVLLLAVLF